MILISSATDKPLIFTNEQETLDKKYFQSKENTIIPNNKRWRAVLQPTEWTGVNMKGSSSGDIKTLQL